MLFISKQIFSPSALNFFYGGNTWYILCLDKKTASIGASLTCPTTCLSTINDSWSGLFRCFIAPDYTAIVLNIVPGNQHTPHTVLSVYCQSHLLNPPVFSVSHSYDSQRCGFTSSSLPKIETKNDNLMKVFICRVGRVKHLRFRNLMHSHICLIFWFIWFKPPL